MAEYLWRLMNFLCVGMLYLKDDAIFLRDLQMDDFKETIVGHWGTCPGVNAIFAHLVDYCIRFRPSCSVKLVISTGHSAPSMLAGAFLDGTLHRYYPDYKRNTEGAGQLFKAYGSIISSEIDAYYPGNIYCGGELGSGLAFSQGYIFNHPERLVACIIGDGELETPACQAAFQGFRLIDGQRDGRVLPIINLNGFKMGCMSIMADRTNSEIEGYFGFFGLQTLFADDSHENISDTIKKCFELMKDGKYPVVVLRTPKGWTAPIMMGGQAFSGSLFSHKPVLKNPSRNDLEYQEVKAWLESYHPSDFFEGNQLKREIIEYIDSGVSVIDFKRDYIDRRSTIITTGSFMNSPHGCCDAIKKERDVIVFSPDELSSNGFDSLRDSCRVVELLSEQTCFGWCQGYSAGGGKPVLITYEAFAPLFDSLVDQYLKTVDALERQEYSLPAISVIVTSLGWRNVPSHHNPGFVDKLACYRDSHVGLYFPLSPNRAATLLRACLRSTNRLNVMTMDKRTLPILFSTERIERDGYWPLRGNLSENNILFITIGDIVTEEVLKAYDGLTGKEKEAVCVVGLETIDAADIMPNNSIVNVWVYNGRPEAVESLLWKQGRSTKSNIVIGFSGNATKRSGNERLRESKVDAETLMKTMKTLLASYTLGE